MLAIQDTSEINFTTTAERRRGLGETAKGNVHGLLLHPMLAVDAADGTCLAFKPSREVSPRAPRRTPTLMSSCASWTMPMGPLGWIPTRSAST